MRILNANRYLARNDPAAEQAIRRWLALDPLQEEAHRRLMRFYADKGNYQAALQQYERCQQLLDEELGVPPAVETEALAQRILRDRVGPPTVKGEENSSALARISASHPGKAEGRVYNFPQQLTPFIGRKQELADLHQRLADPVYRLITIAGPGGIGKSRLAMLAATQQGANFRDGIFFVPLAQVQSAELLPAAILDALNLPHGAGEKSTAEQLFEMLSQRQALLLLDNFEHLMDGVAFILNLLQRVPSVVLLVTSREQFNIQAEDLFALRGLPVPASDDDANAASFDAVRLFVERAHRLDKRFKVAANARNGNLNDVVRICQQVEGFPLGIELAASWIRELPCHDIVEEIDASLGNLEAAHCDVAPQHRSLRSVFDSSWRLLSRTEQGVLAQLSVFRGGFTMAAARAAVGASIFMLGRLRNKSLLHNTGPRRYEMHELIRQFAGERLARNGDELLTARAAHGNYFLQVLCNEALPLDTNDARNASDRIQPDWENVRLAWQWATETNQFAQLADALDGLTRFVELRSFYQEAESLLEETVDELRAQQQTLPFYHRCLNRLAFLAHRRDNALRAGQLVAEALACAQQGDDQEEIAAAYLTQACVQSRASEYEEAVYNGSQALKIAQDNGSWLLAGQCKLELGFIAYQRHDFVLAEEMLHSVVAIHEEAGRLELPNRVAMGYLSNVAVDQGRYDMGLHYGQRYLDRCIAVNDSRSQMIAQHYLAITLNILGYLEEALALEQESVAIAERLGIRIPKSFLLHTTADLLRQLGRLQEAMTCADESVIIAREFEAPLALGYALEKQADVLADMALLNGEWMLAEAGYREAAETFYAIDRTVAGHGVTVGLARMTYRRGDVTAAHQQIKSILPLLPVDAAEGWWNLGGVYATCVEILREAGDARANSVLHAGLTLIERLAQNITERSHRRHYLLAGLGNPHLFALAKEGEAVDIPV